MKNWSHHRSLSSVDSTHIRQSVIPLSDTVRVLWFILDKNLLMTNHVSSVIKSYFFHLHWGKLCQYLNRKTVNATAVSLVLSKLDNCNSCLRGTSKNQLLRLQRVQNPAARIVTGQTKRSHHITPIFHKLHWVPVKMCTDYKILSLVYSCINGTGTPTPHHTPNLPHLQELIPITFRCIICGPPIWSSLLQCWQKKQHQKKKPLWSHSIVQYCTQTVKQSAHNSMETFKKNLKTNLFSKN